MPNLQRNLNLANLKNTPLTDKDGNLTRPWFTFFSQLADAVNAILDLDSEVANNIQ